MKIIITEGQYKRLCEVTVYRGEGGEIFGQGYNEGFLWVSTDEELAKNYASYNDKEKKWNVEKLEIDEPNAFEFPYRENTYVTSENMANIFRQLMIRKIKAKEMTKEQWREMSSMIKQYETNAGEKLEPYYTKLNKTGVSRLAASILKKLGYDAVKIIEDGIKTYGLIKI